MRRIIVDLVGASCAMSDHEKVDAIIRRISGVRGISWGEARTTLHKYVCEGRCDWYKTKSRAVGFDRFDLTDEERRLAEEAIKEFMGDVDIEEAKWRIHRVLCPGHPRPYPGRTGG